MDQSIVVVVEINEPIIKTYKRWMDAYKRGYLYAYRVVDDGDANVEVYSKVALTKSQQNKQVELHFTKGGV